MKRFFIFLSRTEFKTATAAFLPVRGQGGEEMGHRSIYSENTSMEKAGFRATKQTPK